MIRLFTFSQVSIVAVGSVKFQLFQLVGCKYTSQSDNSNMHTLET